MYAVWLSVCLMASHSWSWNIHTSRVTVIPSLIAVVDSVSQWFRLSLLCRWLSVTLIPCVIVMSLTQFHQVFVCVSHTERQEAEGLQSEVEWLSEMTEDEYNELTPRTRLDVDHIRLQLNKERLKKYFAHHYNLFLMNFCYKVAVSEYRYTRPCTLVAVFHVNLSFPIGTMLSHLDTLCHQAFLSVSISLHHRHLTKSASCKLNMSKPPYSS